MRPRQQKRTIRSGVSSFKRMRRRNSRGELVVVHADKTQFIASALSMGEVTLMVYPIRFLKSSNLSMLGTFLDVRHADAEGSDLWFKDMKITTTPEYQYICDQHQYQYPVISVSFKDVDGDTAAIQYSNLRYLFAELYESFRYVLDSEAVSDEKKATFCKFLNQAVSESQLPTALKFLSSCLHDYHNKPCMLLIDEYDTPLYKLHMADRSRPDSEGELPVMNKFFSTLLKNAMKENEHVEKSWVTGVLRTPFGSLVSALNNVEVYSSIEGASSDEKCVFAGCFGLTESDVKDMIAQTRIDEQLSGQIFTMIERHYNGYRMNGEKSYNPWSINAYLKKCVVSQAVVTAKDFWIQTGEAQGLQHYMEDYIQADQRVADLLTELRQGRTVVVDVSLRTVFSSLLEKEKSAFWGLLIHTGYLTVVDVHEATESDGILCSVRIPNAEVKRGLLVNFKAIANKQSKKIGFRRYEQALEDLIYGNPKLNHFKDYLAAHISGALTHDDFPKARGDQEGPMGEQNIHERVYHACLNGILSALDGNHFYQFSEVNAGYGRADGVMIPMHERIPGRKKRQHGIVLEFKSVSRNEVKPSATHEDIQRILSRAADAGLKQIYEKQYAGILRHYGVPSGLHIAIAFFGKHFCIKFSLEEYPLDPSKGFSPMTAPLHELPDALSKVVDDLKVTAEERASRESLSSSPHSTSGLTLFSEQSSTHKRKREAISQAQLLKSVADMFEFQCYDVPRDGACFFSAASHQLQLIQHPDSMGASELRAAVVQYMSQHADFFASTVEDVQAYLTGVADERTWVDHRVLLAFSRRFQVRLVIIQSDGEDPIFITPEEADDVSLKTLYLGYEVGMHYQSLISLTGDHGHLDERGQQYAATSLSVEDSTLLSRFFEESEEPIAKVSKGLDYPPSHNGP